MENTAMFEALKAENLKVKKELENLRIEILSIYLSKNVPSGIDKFKEMVGGTSQKTIDGFREQCSQKSEISPAPSTQLTGQQFSANALSRKQVN